MINHKITKKALMLLTLLPLVVCLSSCKSTLVVNGHFPEPVISQLPLTVAVVYPEAFKKYRYVEKNEQRSDWDISLGEAQVKLFDTVLNAMFAHVVPASSVNGAGQPVDLYFQPNVEEFQYNVPNETKVKMYEVWIKYNMTVYDDQGQLIADWILTAYGKTPTAFMKSEESAMNETMVIALRDIGAGLSLHFTNVPEINNWLKQKNASML